MIPRLKRFLRRSDAREDERLTRIFGRRLRDQRLWSLNRHGVATGAAVGLFCAYLPMPMQMLPATIASIALRGNLPFALALVWISNPLTWIPFYTPAYHLGRYILGMSGESEFTIGMLKLGTAMEPANLHHIVEFVAALWVGCLVLGAAAAVVGYFAVLNIWRFHVVSRWRSRREARRRTRAIRKIRDKAEEANKAEAANQAENP